MQGSSLHHPPRARPLGPCAPRGPSAPLHHRSLSRWGQCARATLADELPELCQDGQLRQGGIAAGASVELLRSVSLSNSTHDLEGVLRSFDARLGSAQVLAAAWEQLARRRRRPGFRAQASAVPLLERLTAERMADFSPGQLGTIARSCTLVSGRSSPLVPALLSAALHWAPEGIPALGLVELAWAAAQAGRPPPPGFLPLLEAAVGPEREAQDWGAWLGGASRGTLTMLLWALAALDCRPSPAFWQAAAARLQALRPSTLHTKSLVMLLWAVGTLRCPQQRLMALLTRELTLRLEAAPAPEPASPAVAPPGGPAEEGEAVEPGVPSTPAPAVGGQGRQGGRGRSGDGLSPRRLALVLWACGRQRHRVAALLRAAAPLLQSGVEHMAADDVSKVLWGLSRLQHSPLPLLDALSERLQQPRVLADLGPSQLATAAAAFAALNYRPGALTLDALAAAALALRGRLDPGTLSQTLWSLTRLGYSEDSFYQAFVPGVLEDIKGYAPPELADLALVFSRLGAQPPGGLLDALAGQLVAVMEDATMQDIVRVVEAFHSLGLQPGELLDAVEAWADRRLSALTPQALSLALWNFARLGNAPPRLLRTATACVEARLPEFEVVPLARVVWSLAKLGQRSEPLMAHAAAALAGRGEEFGDKAASNVLWALATLGYWPGAAALDAIAAKLQPRLRGHSAQSLANIGWAYATLGHRPPVAFMQCLGDVAKGQIRAFEPLGLSLLVWSLARLDHRHNALLLRIVADCGADGGARLRQFEGQQLSMLLWGIAKVGFHPGPDFLRAFAKEAEARAAALRPQELYNIAWAYGCLRFTSKGLMAAVARQVAAQPSAFSPHEVSGTLWAFARLRHRAAAGPVAQAAQAALLARPAQFEGSHLARVVWSLGELRQAPEPGVAAALLRSVRAAAPTLSPESLTTISTGLAKLELAPGGELGGALLRRALALLPSLKPYEFTALLAALVQLAVDGSYQLLLPAAAAEAAAAAPITAAVELLWVMATLGAYPEPAFSKLCARLRRTSPAYQFTRQRLVQLGQALRLAGPEQAARLKPRSELRRRALAAAAAGHHASSSDEEGESESELADGHGLSGTGAGGAWGSTWFTMPPSSGDDL